MLPMSTPGCPGLIPRQCHGCSTQGSGWHGVCPAPGSPNRGKAAQNHLPSTQGFCSPFPGSFCWGLVAYWQRWEPQRWVGSPRPRLYQEPCGCLGSVPPGGFLSSYGSHTAAAVLLLSWIFHESFRCLWALLYNDAESQRFQLLPESV